MDLNNFKHNLIRLKKCDQYWDEMSLTKGGRACGKCAKTIVDFSNMTFTDIAFFMSETRDPVCGFYLPEQLQQINGWKNKVPLAIGFSTLILTSSLANPVKYDGRIFSNLPIDKANRSAGPESYRLGVVPISDTLYLSGRVNYFDTAKESHQAVSFASIIIKGSRNGITTMNDGHFRLPYVPASDSGKIQLVISSIGLETKELEINFNGTNEIQLGTITLDNYKGELTEFYVTVRKRSKLNMMWRKLTKPLRR